MAALRIEKKERVFEVEEIKKWIEKACLALHYAHDEAGVIHRDLKPANLMLTSRGQIKIADFGISQSMCDSISRLTMRRGSSGTLAYMSPQQMGGEKSRVTDDVYALGATIYELLTGKPPFYCGDLAFQVRLCVARSMKERREELEITGEEIPQEWEEAVGACLAKIPEERPASMLELAKRLGLSSPAGPSAPAKAPIVIEQQAARKVIPPPLPRKSFPIQRLWQMGGVACALALIACPLWYFLFWPLVATRGGIRVSSDPSAALVHLSGQPDRITPAYFSHLRIGRYRIVLSKQGFDPIEQEAKIAPGAEINLGTLNLKRAFGELQLSTLPPRAHYLLSGAENTGNFRREGMTPEVIPNLPEGTYQLGLSAPGFPEASEVIQIPAHGTISEKADLIQLAVSASAAPNTANPSDFVDRSHLVDVSNRAFEEYLNHGLLSPAAGQLAILKGLGESVVALEDQLAGRRSTVEATAAAQIEALLKKKKFATAREKLAALQSVLEKESMERLNALFQSPLAQYQGEVDTVVKANQNVPLETTYQQIKAFAALHPDDPQLQIALAEVQTNMAPVHDRLDEQLKSFRQFSAQDKDFVPDPAMLNMQTALTNELNQLDALADALAAAKSGSSHLQEELERLKSEKAAFERRRVKNAQNNPFAQAVNFFGKVVVGHSVVDNGFSSEGQKEDAISEVQSRIEAVEQQLALPSVPADQAQKQYNDFVARVPWDPGAKPAP